MQTLRWVQTDLLYTFFDVLINTGRVMVRSTRTREQNRDIVGSSCGKAATPFVDHRSGTANSLGQLLTGPVGMQVQEMTKVSTLSHPQGFHRNLLSSK